MFHLFHKSPPIPTGPVEYLIVGLGNPGRQYENTRHNAGFMTMDYLANQCHAQINRIKFKALVGDAELGGKAGLTDEAPDVYESQRPIGPGGYGFLQNSPGTDDYNI